jgi:hypothetical protein
VAARGRKLGDNAGYKFHFRQRSVASLIAPGTTDFVNPDAAAGNPLLIFCMSTAVVKAAVVVAAAVTPIADCGIEQKNLSHRRSGRRLLLRAS